MAPRDVRGFLEASLAVLAHEAPPAYQRLCRTLAGRRVCIADGSQRFTLRFESNAVVTTPETGAEEIRTGVDRRTILALVDGALTLTDAVREERLVVRAAIADAAAAFDALLIYVGGAVRCPSFPRLLSEFRASGGGEELR